MQITLNTALKRKKRVLGWMTKVSTKIKIHNSRQIVEGDESPKVNIDDLLKEHEALTAHLIELKTAIAIANAPIQSSIFKLSELKSGATMLAQMATREGKFPSRYGMGEVQMFDIFEAQIKEEEVEGMQESIADAIECTQEALEKHNATTIIEIEDYKYNP